MSEAGDWMKSVRVGANQTQDTVARALGISEGYLGDIERGRRAAPMDVVIRFCERFEYDPLEAVLEYEMLPRSTVEFLRRAASVTA